MVNRKWAYRELFDSEREAARAYDAAVWRLKPGEAKSYVNFKARAGAMRLAGLQGPCRPLMLAATGCLQAHGYTHTRQ